MRFFLGFALTVLSIYSNGQSFSTFYGTYNVNQNVQVDQNINVSGKIESESTIHTIDYGALAQANAISEANRLNLQQYNDQKALQIGESIAKNPLNAYSYGYPRLNKTLRSWAINRGIKPKYGVFFTAPSNALFDSYEYDKFRNVSSSGIITEFSIPLPMDIEYANEKVKSLYSKEDFEWYTSWGNNPRGAVEMTNLEVGTEYTWGFLHAKELYTAKVYTKDGYRGTRKFEDEFHIYIEDRYAASLMPYGGVFTTVTYKADKRKHTFEDLEGRRYYLQPLIEKVIANARFPTTDKQMRLMRIYNY